MGGFADYYGQTSIHPLAAVAALILAAAAISLPRRYALIPLFFAATTIPMAQRLVVAGADFTLLRFLLLTYVIRIFIKGEIKGLHWNRLDTLVLLWTVSGTVIMTIQIGSFSAFVNRIGWSYEILLTYLAARCFLRDENDLRILAKAVAIISIPVAISFIFEWMTRHNMFSIFGGVQATTPIREGRLRCQGPFSHPILAGTFWAACLPLIWMLWPRLSGARILCALGTIAAVTIVIACSSSTPILAAAVAFFGAFMFRYRHRRKLIWKSGLATILVLHFVIMDSPVWHLMARVNIVGGSTGWHRYRIFDAFVNNFREWYLVGEPDPMSWGVWQMRDITNQYILEGLRGGLITLLFFVLILITAFSFVGKSLTNSEKLESDSAVDLTWYTWLIGTTMFIHAVTFLGLSYFGQMEMILYLQIGIVGSICSGRALKNVKAYQKNASRSRQFPIRSPRNS